MKTPHETGDILALNAGSSSIKFSLFDADLTETLSGLAAEIGGQSTLKINGETRSLALPDHQSALAAILDALRTHGRNVQDLRAVAHRVVHGGATLTHPHIVSADVLVKIADCTPLAPLHNPHNLAAIHAVASVAPDLVQTVSFDTAFHASNPDVATRYAIPESDETKGIRRYGFHGLSYASLVRNFSEISGTPLPPRLLTLHLGNGASLCAIKDAKSIATTMGYSPLDGLTMGTRSGGIDANAVLKLVEDCGLPRTRAILNNESGLLGLSGGKSDMRALMLDPAPNSSFAIDHFCYWTLRHAGSLIAAMKGLDAIVFTGGIGENASQIRARILHGLVWAGVTFNHDANTQNHASLHNITSAVTAWIIPAQEERELALDAVALLDA